MPSTQVRQEVLRSAKCVVIKLGTQLLTKSVGDNGQTGVDQACLRRIASQVSKLRERGIEVTLVSSGAVGAGCVELEMPERPTDLGQAQAVAAVGQQRLMAHWRSAFSRVGIKVAQLLLSRDDFDDRARFLNIRNTLASLHDMGCVPILNENDAVTVDELRFGDNDLLAALVSNAQRADALVLLTVVDGLLDEQGDRVDLVEHVGDHYRMARQDKSKWGSGGMMSKLESARLVTAAGELAVIANGREKNILPRLIEGEKLGTIFLPAKRKLDSRSRWIGLTARPSGTVTINGCACKALVERGKSLLAIGITGMTGQFSEGEIVLVRDEQGRELGRGLINYSESDMRKIIGKHSDDFETLLGRVAYTCVIHRDNLVLTQDHKPGTD